MKARGLTATALVLVAGFMLGWAAQFGVPGLGGFAAMWPQKWVFFIEFDKNSVAAYRVAGAGRALAPLEDIGRGGLGRAAESRLIEAWYLARLVPEDHWQGCARLQPTDCGLDLDLDRTYRMSNHDRGSHLCGRLAFSVEKADVPPAGQLPASPTRVHRIAVVDLDCE